MLAERQRKSRQRREQKAARLRSICRRNYIENYGDPRRAKLRAYEEAKSDPILVGFLESILISIGIKILWAIIEALIDHWSSNKVKFPNFGYQPDEPGYPGEFQDD